VRSTARQCSPAHPLLVLILFWTTGISGGLLLLSPLQCWSPTQLQWRSNSRTWQPKARNIRLELRSGSGAINFVWHFVTSDGLATLAFFFQSWQHLVTAADTYFNLINGVKTGVLWVVGTVATIANSVVEGSILAGKTSHSERKRIARLCPLPICRHLQSAGFVDAFAG
jgi:hypothetical protein